jgi:hypothetical protein
MACNYGILYTSDLLETVEGGQRKTFVQAACTYVNILTTAKHSRITPLYICSDTLWLVHKRIRGSKRDGMSNFRYYTIRNFRLMQVA